MPDIGLDIPGVPSIPTRDELVAETLRQAILRGELAPGQKLDQTTVAQRLGVSRSPVREALKTLAAEGLVELQPHRTATVVELSLEEMEEIYDIREVLESMAARLAAPRMDDERLAKLRELLEKMDESTTVREWSDLNSAFHSLIYEAAGRPRLVEIIFSLRTAAGPYIARYIASEGHKEMSQVEHREIYEACKARDGERAAAAVREHIVNGAADMRARSGLEPRAHAD